MAHSKWSAHGLLSELSVDDGSVEMAVSPSCEVTGGHKSDGVAGVLGTDHQAGHTASRAQQPKPKSISRLNTPPTSNKHVYQFPMTACLTESLLNKHETNMPHCGREQEAQQLFLFFYARQTYVKLELSKKQNTCTYLLTPGRTLVTEMLWLTPSGPPADYFPNCL